MEFLELFDLLHKRNIRYLLCGGLAVSIYGIQRTTADIDLLLDFEEENLKNFLNAMKLLSYVGSLPFSIEVLSDEKMREELIEHKNLIAYSFYNSRRNTFLVDVIVKSPFSFDELWDRREQRTPGSITVNLVSISDLISLKKVAGRQQDEDDIKLLSRLLNHGN